MVSASRAFVWAAHQLLGLHTQDALGEPQAGYTEGSARHWQTSADLSFLPLGRRQHNKASLWEYGSEKR